MNVLLTTSAAPSQTPFSTNEKRLPVGLGFLISVLRASGHNVLFIDNYLSPSNFLETDYLQRHQIDFVGIYTNTICFRDSLRMFYRLEEMRQQGTWNGKIIAGGPHASVCPETIPTFVDHIVIGEGEYAIRDIVAGKVKERIVRYLSIENLDELPMPAWDCFAKMPYDWGGNWLPEAPVFTMNTSRGCPFDCTFCSVGSIWGKRYTYFSAERVVADIEYLVKHHGARGIYFREDNFTLNKKRLYDFCNLMISKSVNIPWVCETRASSLDRETVELMARAGAKGAYIGVESGSQRLLDFMHKGINLEDIHRAFQLCHEFRISTAASVIVGVPTETEQEQQMTVDLLAAIKPTVSWFNVFVGIPKSRLYEYVLNEKLYEYIDDRGLVYLKGHNERVKRWYGEAWDAGLPVQLENKTIVNPRISVLMSVYNGEKHVLKAIQSIQRQTYNNFEFIIVDDASTDSTPLILDEIDDPRVRVFKNQNNIGLTRSLNKALKHCRGEFIARMDADDFSVPHRFETQVTYLESNPSIALVGCAYYIMNDEGVVHKTVDVLTDPDAIYNDLIRQNWFGHGSVMMRRNCLCSAGGYDEEFTYAQDYDLFLRLSEKFKLANVAEPLYFWRKSQQGISQQKEQEQKYFSLLARKRAVCRRSITPLLQAAPLVSVIIPTFNRPDMLREAIKSILSQTFRDFEIIVINDAGLDVQQVVRSFNCPSIRYIVHETNKGLAAARNTGIKAAKGKYITYLDDDDRYYADHLETLVRFLENNPAYQAAYTDAYRTLQEVMNGKLVTVNKDIPYSFDFDYDRILKENFIPVLCVMHHKSCFETVEPFDERLKRTEDWDLWLRLSRHFSFAHIKKATCEFSVRNSKDGMMQGRKEPFNWAALHMCHKYRRYVHNKPEILAHHNTMVRSALENIIRSLGEGIAPDLVDIQKLLCVTSVDQAIKEATFLTSCYPEEASRFKKLIHHLTYLADKAEVPKSYAPRLIAFHLPQFHTIPENDTWWGKGFTEWTNVRNAQPLFDDHYQPHVPADLGYYDLSDPSALKEQAALAQEYGVHGFCFYHYWFNGKLLLETPLHQMLKSGEPNFPFCLCWANEDWTRAWDGRSGEILIGQNYSDSDDARHFFYLLNFFEDKRYIRVNGKPLFLVYRANRLPNPLKTTATWRALARKAGLGELYLCRVESFSDEHTDPTTLGFDAAVEFQPDWRELGQKLTDPAYGTHTVYDYPAVVENMCQKQGVSYTRFPCVTPSWDNSPRRKSDAVIFINSSPTAYQRWLNHAISRVQNHSDDERLVFINAWNEWGEGNHLEPDQKFGRGYLEVTKSAVTGASSVSNKTLSTDEYGSVATFVYMASIIIPVFNKVDYTRKCIQAIIKNTPNVHFEVLIVDNASTDSTKDYLAGLSGDVKVVTNDENVGYTIACNQAAQIAGGRHLVFLNNDTEPQRGWLEALLQLADSEPAIGAVGAKLVYPDGRLQEAGGIIYRDARGANFGRGDSPGKLQYNQVSEVDYCSGACLLIKHDLFTAIGGFDERYAPAYYEDTDLCFSVRRQGFKVMYCPDATVIHYEYTTSGSDPNAGFRKYLAINRQKFIDKWQAILLLQDEHPEISGKVPQMADRKRLVRGCV